MKHSSIVLVGESTPIQKVLPIVLESENVNLVALFGNKNESAIVNTCTKNNIEVYDMNSLKSDEGLSFLKQLSPDWVFNINSTILFSESFLTIPRNGTLNLHCGILPHQAGKHAHQWAIRSGEKEFGVTLHWVNKGIDTGDIVSIAKFAIEDKDTGLSLYLKYIAEGVKLIKDVICKIEQKQEINATKQDITKRIYHFDKEAKNGLIKWSAPANDVLNFVRAADYGPFKSPTYIPYTTIKNTKLYVNKVSISEKKSLGEGIVEICDKNKIAIGTSDYMINVLKYKCENDYFDINSGDVCASEK